MLYQNFKAINESTFGEWMCARLRLAYTQATCPHAEEKGAEGGETYFDQRAKELKVMSIG